MLTLNQFRAVEAELERRGFLKADVDWSEHIEPPSNADDFALEAIFVICNSGMKNTVARMIYDRVQIELWNGRPASGGFGHKGKCAAIDHIWRYRLELWKAYMILNTDGERLNYLAELPWIGGITKYHLAKNFGANVAKPDIHLQRLANFGGETVQGLCDRLAADTGYRAATVDLIVWRACAEGVIDSRSGQLRLG